ncbi:HEPN domain-containing protein [Streptomyces roseoviridis]|uniref:HEPN domain-containing protein n=1 Tax=Streptomyces roseoviridis TaxID=67361 RepID=A0ABV5QLK0_9ACTN
MYDDPITPQEWEDVAQERRVDAMELHRAGRHLACLYYLGFAAECLAKALCAAQGRPAPRGHDVLALIEHAGFSSQVLPQNTRNFLTDRDVSLRYQAALPDDVKIDDEIEAARRFMIWCITQLRRRPRARGAKAHRRKAQ